MKISKFKIAPNGATVELTSDDGYKFRFSISKWSHAPSDFTGTFEVARTFGPQRGVEWYYIAAKTVIDSTHHRFLDLSGSTREDWFKEMVGRLLFSLDTED